MYSCSCMSKMCLHNWTLLLQYVFVSSRTWVGKFTKLPVAMYAFVCMLTHSNAHKCVCNVIIAGNTEKCVPIEETQELNDRYTIIIII